MEEKNFKLRSSHDAEYVNLSLKSSISLSSSIDKPSKGLLYDQTSSKRVQNFSPGGTLKTSVPEIRVFNVPIDMVKVNNAHVPLIVEHLISNLEKRALNEEGILRLAGSTEEIKRLREIFDQGVLPDLTKTDVHVLSGLLKLWLRELPKPPLSSNEAIRDAGELETDNERAVVLQEEIQKIHMINYQTLKRIFGFCAKIATNSKITKMTSQNIAIVFHPTLHLQIEILVTLVNKYSEIFAE